MSRTTENVAAICGLYCGICNFYPSECGGCMSGNVRKGCDVCHSGFRECAAERGIARCSECDDFPCERMERFRDDKWPHHDVVIDNVRRQREVGVAAWLEEQEFDHACPGCGSLVWWELSACQNCQRDFGKVSL